MFQGKMASRNFYCFIFWLIFFRIAYPCPRFFKSFFLFLGTLIVLALGSPLWSSGERRGLTIRAMFLGRGFKSRLHLRTRCKNMGHLIKKNNKNNKESQKAKSHQKQLKRFRPTVKRKTFIVTLTRICCPTVFYTYVLCRKTRITCLESRWIRNRIFQ